MTTTITPIGGEAYETDIALVLTKGCRPKPCGKTGYYSVKVPSVSSKAPTHYRLHNKDGDGIDTFLTAARCNARAKVLAGEAPKAKRETAAQAYERGFADGYAAQGEMK